jgi:uncharacterized protein YcfJ
MKILTTLVFAAMATSAQADTKYVRATVIGVEPLYETVEVSVPVRECYSVKVPGSRPSTADVAAGAIIGGVIGNQFGGGSGKDAMTTLGMILGADVANKQGGTRTEQQCVTNYTTSYEEEITGYLVTYKVKRKVLDFISDRRYKVGDRIRVAVED